MSAAPPPKGVLLKLRGSLDSTLVVKGAIGTLVAAVLLGGLLTTAVPASSQVVVGKLTGVVTDAQTGEPIAGALVYLEGTGMGSVSAENGRYFVINVPPGSDTVMAELIGYQTLRVENVLVVINATRTLDFELAPRPIAVDEIGVKVESMPWAGTRQASRRITALRMIETPDLRPTTN